MGALRVDLHLHTTASDGQLTPAALVQLARQRGLNAIAITDHDTTDGIAPARAEAAGWPAVIGGIELSAEENGADVHVLGYYLEPDEPGMQTALADFRRDRLKRAHRMVERLAELGKRVEWERVTQIAGEAPIGRPHIARALMEAGHVSSIAEAFELYLYTGGPAYAARPRLTPEEAIALIHRASGAAVLAHPGLLADPLALIERLIPAGLDGVEVMHPRNGADLRRNLRALADRHGLIVTGGSDFHRVQDMIGAENPPAGCLRALRERAGRYRASPG